MKKVTILILAFILMTFYVVNSYSAAEKDPVASRVPADQVAAAKAMKNPVASNPANIAKGNEIRQFNEEVQHLGLQRSYPKCLWRDDISN